jgi:2-polyprenyl-3-methyl-5-hydroxy-6-metoxy-1,4-benzoquinol methylase
MWISEQILYGLAKLLYKSEAAHSREMKCALTDRSEYKKYRRRQVDIVLTAAKAYGIAISEKIVLDLGCGDGSIGVGYLDHGAAHVIGVDIDAEAIEQARQHNDSARATFHVGTTTALPLEDNSVDVILCYDVFEHVSQPAAILAECRRVLRPGGKMLIGTWGWRHPYAPHLWSTMPVPWAHIFFSEKTLLRACRRVYQSAWYVPNMHDLDESGKKKEGRYEHEEISTDYLNKMLIRDFEKAFAQSGMSFEIFPQPFGSRYARWTKVFLNTPWLREFLTGYIWVVLTKHQVPALSLGDRASPSGAPTAIAARI